jgi:hypothetical protein
VDTAGELGTVAEEPGVAAAAVDETEVEEPPPQPASTGASRPARSTGSAADR